MLEKWKKILGEHKVYLWCSPWTRETGRHLATYLGMPWGTKTPPEDTEFLIVYGGTEKARLVS